MSAFSSNQRFLITGASSGIGRAIALRLHAEGATVIAQGRDQSRLESLANEIKKTERIYFLQRDFLKDVDKLSSWFDDICSQYGPLQGLVCSAGITWNCPMSYYPLEKAHELFDLCCHAPLILGGAFSHKHNNTGKGCSIVYIAAAAAIQPNTGQGIYAAAKAGLVGGARCQAIEFARLNIRVNCISPGLVQTPMMESTVKQLGQSFLEREQDLYPLGIGRPEDIANMALFMLTEKSRWLTGQNILLSGGR